MKKEDLLKIEGMTEAIAAEVVKLSGEELKGMVPKSRLDEVIAERDHAKADHADVLKQLGALQKETGDVEGMKQKISELETAAKETSKTHAAEIRQLKIDNAVSAALSGAKALNPKAVKALLNLDKAELNEDGTIKGLDEQIKTLQKAEDSKMLFGSAAPKMKGAKLNEPRDEDPSGMTMEAFRAMSPVDRHKFASEHPEEYKQLYSN